MAIAREAEPVSSLTEVREFGLDREDLLDDQRADPARRGVASYASDFLVLRRVRRRKIAAMTTSAAAFGSTIGVLDDLSLEAVSRFCVRITDARRWGSLIPGR